MYTAATGGDRHPVDYALFIAFFPQLVAGPIVRAREFFADLYAWRAPDGAELSRGALLVLFGLAKKMAIADQFALIAGPLFPEPGGVLRMADGMERSGCVRHADLLRLLRLHGYGDRDGTVVGVPLSQNFRRPYLAASITDFWRRWHMSLSRWLRDYLYISLGGSRRGAWRTYLNLMLTMLLGGLWHGASWRFIVWGAYHGALLGVERAAGQSSFPGWMRALRPLRVVLTFGLVLIGWVFFRAGSLHDCGVVISRLFSGPVGTPLWHRWQIDVALGTLLLGMAEEKFGWFDRLVSAPDWVYGGAAAVLLLALELIGVTEIAVPFVYFQF